VFFIPVPANIGVNNAELGVDEDENGEDNVNVEQSNEQDIEEVSKGSSAENEAVNDAEFHGSNDNDVSQSNDQDINNVEDDSHAENDAGNSVSFDESDGDTPCTGCG
jgi:hypothetical protein